MAKAKPNTSQPAKTSPAPKRTREQAGAGETQSASNVRPDAAEGQPAEPPVVVALLVTSQVEGFRRAGRAWSREQTRVEIADLTEEQVEALLGESMLDVIGVAE